MARESFFMQQRTQTFMFGAFMAALSIGLFYVSEPMSPPQLDATRYADYALNIFDHGIFGLTGNQREVKPAPGNANSPLYPAFVALSMWLDPGFADSIRCELGGHISKHHSGAGQCTKSYGVITALQLTLAALAVMCIWLTTQRLFARLSVSWLASILVVATTKTNFFAHQLLTENLVLLFFALMLLFITLVLQTNQKRWWGLLGTTVGLLTLSRPEYLYLLFAFLLLSIGLGCFFRDRQYWLRNSIFALAAIIVLSPWVMRNHAHFGHYTLTGGYGDKTIAYRVAYNRMSQQEWRAAFIYWLPGYGEILASKYLPAASYKKLGTDPASYLYKEGTEIFDKGLLAVDGDRKKLTGYLIKTEILDRPVAHFLASVPLAWRGVLSGKYLAIVGLPCFIFLLFYALRNKHYLILALCFPATVLIAFYAAVSVSIPRYNIYLIYYYGIASAWFLTSAVELIRKTFSPTSERTDNTAAAQIKPENTT
jgi:hypothetical protein